MIDALLSYSYLAALTTWVGVCLYWLPMCCNAFAYTLRTWHNYQKDKAKLKEVLAMTDRRGFYNPTDTVGSVVGRVLATVVPGVNLIACVFDASSEITGLLSRWLDRPLVPDTRD